MTLTQITEKGIKDGEIVNADINASAAIAGSKISPAFTSNITGTGDLTLSSGGSDRLKMTHAGGGQFVIKNPSAAALSFGTNNQNNELFIKNGGNVGIGTNAPVSTLQINSTRNAETDRFDATNYHLALRNPEDDNGEAIGLSFGITSNTTKVGAAILHERDGGGSQGSLQFYTNSDGTSITERMRIASSGNVGVGTNNPDSLLHVYGATTGYAKIETGDGSTNPILMHKNPDRIWHTGLRGDTSDSYVIRDATATANRLVIDTNGKIGIGTDAPSSKLEINGSANAAEGIIIKNTNNTQGDATAIVSIRGGDNASGRLQLECNSQFHEFIEDSLGNLVIEDNGTERMRIDSSGKIMIPIGTTTRLGIADRTSGTGAGGSLLVSAGAARGSSQNTGNLLLGSGRGNDSANNGVIQFGYTDGSDGTGLDGEWMRLSASGQLLIGTTSTTGVSSGSDDIVIGSIGDSTTRGITFATTDSAAIRWADAGDNAMGRISYSNSTDVMTFHTSNATRLRLDSDGMKFGTDSAAANALDDYEEGVFTVGVSCPSGSVTLHSGYNEASYTKVGRLVHVMAYLVVSSISSPSGTLTLTGLPFTSADTQDKSAAARFPISMYLNGSSLPDGQGTYTGSAYVNEGVTELSINFVGTNTSGKQTNNCADQLAGGSDFFLNFSYIT